MSAALSEPILLANYALPSSSSAKSQDTGVFDGFATVYASHTEIAGTSDGQVTIAAQRDGIHIFDLSDLHPVHSHTLGPSTSFACPPLTIASSSSSEPRLRRTIAAMRAGQGVSKEAEGKTLWQWTSPLHESTGAQSGKQSSSLSHSISAILPIAGGHAACVSQECDVTVIGEDLQPLGHWKPSEEQRLIKAFAHPKAKYALAPNASSRSGTFVFIFSQYASKKVRLHLLSVSQVGKTNVVNSRDCPVQNPERVIDVSLDQSGHLSFLENDGHWTHAQAEIRDGCLSLSHSERIRLKSLLFTSQPTTTQKLSPHASVSILALRSSFVLLAGVTSSPSRDIAILLWDVQYGVLLNSYMLPMPSHFEDLQPSSISISLNQGSSTQVLLAVSPFGSPSQPLPSGQLHSTILVLPFTVPEVSTIACALGKSSQGSRWIVDVVDVPPELKLAPNDDAVVEVIDEPREKLLEAMQDTMEEGNPKKAEALFMDWYNSEAQKVEVETEKSIQQQQQQQQQQQPVPDENRQQWPAPWKREVYMNDLFIRRLLEVALQPDNPKNKRHAAEVLRFLLEKRIVGYGLLGGGLLPVLLRYSDWKSIFLTLKRVPDVPEDVLMQILHVVVEEYRKRASNDDAMNTDDRYPPLKKLLAACVNYPTSSVPNRAAIRKHFKDADDVFLVLEVLVGWLNYWCDEQVSLLHEKKKRKDRKKEGSGLPRGSTDRPELPSILFFLKAILDSSFISLLQHPPSHELLRRVLSLISPQIDFNETLEQLRGPLEPFATKTAMDAIEKENKENGKVQENKEAKSEMRRHVREQREMEELRIGAYQVEEVYL